MKSYSTVYHAAPRRRVSPFAREPHVAVLLGLRNGAAFLAPQLESLAGQSHGNWSLAVSDDGSCDAGPRIARRFAASVPDRPFRLLRGPRRGFAANFLSLLPVAGEAGFAAFCDQDDVWLPGKLARAVERLGSVPQGVPALYCGRTFYTDSALRITGVSPALRHPPSFRNALVQSLAGGNTMVMNRAAVRLLRAAMPPGPVPAHDWWCYLVIAGAGGRIVFDDAPQVLYRQHAGNLIGANRGTRARISRISRLLRGDFRGWTGQNLAALTAAADLLTPEARGELARFAAIRSAAAVLPRLAQLAEARLYRQTRLGNGALWLAAAMGRL